MPHARNLRIDFMAGKLPALAGLCPLRDLYLQFLSVNQIVTGNAESARRHLLDRAVSRIAAWIDEVAARIFAALAGVALAAETVHGDGQRLVRLFANRTVGHRSSFEALDDFCDRLNFIDMDRLA